MNYIKRILMYTLICEIPWNISSKFYGCKLSRKLDTQMKVLLTIQKYWMNKYIITSKFNNIPRII